MVIGVTGPSGAGKGAFCRLLAQHGYYVINADQMVHQIYLKEQAFLNNLIQKFGNAILNDNGQVDRKRLAAIVFASPSEKQKLEQILFPLICQKIEQTIKRHAGETVVLDAPTLLESGAQKFCDKVVAVLADASVRKERICTRDHMSESEANARMQAQPPNDVYIAQADFLVYNNGTRQELEDRASWLLEQIG